MARLTPPTSVAGRRALEGLQDDVNTLYDRFAPHGGYNYLLLDGDDDAPGVYDGWFAQFVRSRRPSTVKEVNVKYFLNDFAQRAVAWHHDAAPLEDGPDGYTKLEFGVYARCSRPLPAGEHHLMELTAIRDGRQALHAASLAVRPLEFDADIREWTDGPQYEVLNLDAIRGGFPNTAGEAIALGGIVRAMAAAVEGAE
ncbi:MAG TPA: hypothetical protein VLI54_06235 [Bacillota bacterium]|nr:hypothetical protein [Bacillota bacterium]